MKLKTSGSAKKILILTFLGLTIIYNSTSQVSIRDTLVTWQHFEYTLNEYNGIATVNPSNIIESNYEGVMLENEFVRLVIVPRFGARILSFLYKPTMHEQFYLNPVGTPYGIGEGNFYYDWLMVMGGVFPTFPEPEHGKTWLVPWEWEITEQNQDRVSLEMTFRDTVDYPGHPGKFNNGITGLICTSTVSLSSGKTSFEFHHELNNPGSSTVPFEYWTCCTLAPGSDPGNTFTPASSEIIAPIDYVYLKDDWWSWMGTVEEPAQGMGPHVFHFENLALYENWDGMGIAYAHPQLDRNYYGVINHENNEGVFRVSDNQDITRGMKFWTWGSSQGLNADPNDFNDIERPYIELWSGLSTRFFEDAYLSSGETATWTETYIPTVELESISQLNEHGAIYQDHYHGQISDELSAQIFMTTPGDNFRVEIILEDYETFELYNDYFIAKSNESQAYSFSLNEYDIQDGEYTYMVNVYGENGEQLISSSVPVVIPLSSWGITDHESKISRILRQSEYAFKIEFINAEPRTIHIYAVDGRLLSSKTTHDSYCILSVQEHGFFNIQVIEGGNIYSVKLFL